MKNEDRIKKALERKEWSVDPWDRDPGEIIKLLGFISYVYLNCSSLLWDPLGPWFYGYGPFFAFVNS